VGFLVWAGIGALSASFYLAREAAVGRLWLVKNENGKPHLLNLNPKNGALFDANGIIGREFPPPIYHF
jgi:hypothetical protein